MKKRDKHISALNGCIQYADMRIDLFKQKVSTVNNKLKKNLIDKWHLETHKKIANKHYMMNDHFTDINNWMVYDSNAN